MLVSIKKLNSSFFSIKKCIVGIYEKLEELENKVNSLNGEPVVNLKKELTKETFNECNSKDELEVFALTLGLEVDKRKSIENIKAEIAEKIGE